MNKGSSTPKRTMGRPQPKRPKLDFTAKTLTHPSPTKSNEPTIGSIKKTINMSSAAENIKTSNVACASDWDDDDDFSSDMLEKVCLIADLSQAMVNNELNNESRMKETADEGIKQGLKRTLSERDILESSSKLFDDLEKLKLENEKLLDTIKTKDGEVQILRSQLKQTQEAKQTERLNNIKLVEEMQSSYKEKLENTQKEFDATRTELQFKELELKSLTERCQQLESNSRIKLVEPQAAQLNSKKPFNVKAKNKDLDFIDSIPGTVEEPISFKFPVLTVHHGQKFGSLICPEYFTNSEEPSVISLYKFNRSCGFHASSLDFDKREKYKWTGLPKQPVFVKDTYNYVSNLFLYENFNEKGAKDVTEALMDIGVKILSFQRDLLLFLEDLQEKNSERDDSDYSLLEDEAKVQTITVKHLLDGKKINREECGIESRRILGVIASLTLSSESVLHSFMEQSGFVLLLRDLAVSVGNLRKPKRYTGILAGITLLLSRFLKYKNLDENIVIVLNEIIQEIIFARPKLDVLNLVVDALAMATYHLTFVQGLCRRGSVESCALYMDSKLHQAMFFTKDACPLKLLCTQIMGLSCIPANREMRWITTQSVTKWLNRMMDAPFSQEVKWLPTTSLSETEDRCFDVMECFVYLLNLCLKDYLLFSNIGQEATNRQLLSVVGDGCLLFRRILKTDQRLLHENCHNLRFGTLLKSLIKEDGLNLHQREAVTWVVELLESDLKNQEGSGKISVSNFSDRDMIDALKINDDLIIF